MLLIGACCVLCVVDCLVGLVVACCYLCVLVVRLLVAFVRRGVVDCLRWVLCVHVFVCCCRLEVLSLAVPCVLSVAAVCDV